MNKYIVVGGCSFTFENYKPKIPGYDISYDKWPTILGEKLELPIKNLGHNGASNDYIFRCLISEIIENHDKIEAVLVGWSGWQRTELFIGSYENYHGSHFRKKLNFSYLNNEEFSAAHRGQEPYIDVAGIGYTIMGLEETGRDIYLSSLKNMYDLQQACKIFGIKLIQAQMLNPFNFQMLHYLKEKNISWHSKTKFLHKMIIDKYFNKIDEDNFIGWPLFLELEGFYIDRFLNSNHRIDPTLDTHPNKNGHELIADFYYKKYKELYL